MKTRKVNPFIKAINNQIITYKNEAFSLQTKAMKLSKDRMMLRALHAPMFAKLTENDRLYISMYSKDYLDCIHYNLYMHSLDNFKDKRLTYVLNVAMETITDKVKEVDYAQYDHKEYRFISEEVVLNISAYVKENSPTCKKIMTGMEIKEVPTYKFVCE